MNPTRIAIIRHDGNTKDYFFKCDIRGLESGDRVVVETRHGNDVVTFKGYVPFEAKTINEPYAWILHKAKIFPAQLKAAFPEFNGKKPYAYIEHETSAKFTSDGLLTVAIITLNDLRSYATCHINGLIAGDSVDIMIGGFMRTAIFNGYSLVRPSTSPSKHIIGKSGKMKISADSLILSAGIHTSRSIPSLKAQPNLVKTTVETVTKHFIDTEKIREGSFVQYKKSGSKEFRRGLVSSCDKYNINIKQTRGMDFRINATALANGDGEVEIQTY